MIFFPHRIPKCLFLQKSQRNNKKVTDSKCTDISDIIYIIIYISIYCSPWQPEKEKNQSQPQVEKGEMERGRKERERETDRRRDRQTDRRTDGQTDRQLLFPRPAHVHDSVMCRDIKIAAEHCATYTFPRASPEKSPFLLSETALRQTYESTLIKPTNTQTISTQTPVQSLSRQSLKRPSPHIYLFCSIT